MTARDKKLIELAAKLHADKTVNYIIRAAAIGFAAGMLIMWILTR